MIRVSIIIPTYNCAEYLPATLGSALAQTLHNIEVILVDDGSTDNTQQIAELFGDRIRYHRQDNAGVSAARNQGARLAEGEWLIFLDSDDQLLPHAAAALLEQAEKTKAGVVYGMVIERAKPPGEPRLNGFNYGEGDPPLPAKRNYKRSVIITPGSAIVRKSLHDQVGGFVPTFEPMEDRDYWIKCGFLASARFLDTVVVDKTWRPASAGQQDARRIWNGLRSRLQLAKWCDVHQIDRSGLPVGRKPLIEAALKEATWLKTRIIIPPLIAEGQKAGVALHRLLRSQITVMTYAEGPMPKWFIPLERE